jgi:hypothetical protein
MGGRNPDILNASAAQAQAQEVVQVRSWWFKRFNVIGDNCP